jgi:hypothetical protein
MKAGALVFCQRPALPQIPIWAILIPGLIVRPGKNAVEKY